MEYGSGYWFDLLPIEPSDKQRIFELHEENDRLRMIAIVTGALAIILFLATVTSVLFLKP